MRRILMLLMICCTLLSAANTGWAKDEVLEKDMAVLEKAYIKPLFFSNKGNLAMTKNTMLSYKSAWLTFEGMYGTYRPDHQNWGKYFDAIDAAVQRAEAALVEAGSNPALLKTAVHPALEEVRATMLLLRPRNGFPKFITDKMTIFHEPMEGIALSLADPNLQPAMITPEKMEYYRELLDEASFAWTKVEECDVDSALWGFSPEDTALLKKYVAEERAALNAFWEALAAEDKAMIKQLGPALQPTFVKAYIMFGWLAPNGAPLH